MADRDRRVFHPQDGNFLPTFHFLLRRARARAWVFTSIARSANSPRGLLFGSCFSWNNNNDNKESESAARERRRKCAKFGPGNTVQQVINRACVGRVQDSQPPARRGPATNWNPASLIIPGWLQAREDSCTCARVAARRELRVNRNRGSMSRRAGCATVERSSLLG